MNQIWLSRIALIVTLVIVSATASRAEVGTDCLRPVGTDVIVGDLNSVASWGSVGDIAAFSVGTTSCNVGDEVLLWQAPNNNHPVIGQNMYHLKDGRFEQVGMSWLKHGFLALALNACGCGCQNPNNGALLGIGCSDPYGASLNGQQGSAGTGGLGPRFEVNANTGFFEMPYAFLGDTGDAIFKRLQVHHSDLDPELDGGGKYFVDGHYVTPDDAAAGNQDNNVSYEEVNVNGSGANWSILLTGGTHQESAGIQAWQDQDPTVTVLEFDDPEGGHFILAYQVSVNKDQSFHYEYALYNMNSHLSGRSFTVPIPDGVTVTNVEFHDVDYHSGEPWDGTDWAAILSAGELTWSTDTFATDEFANALRWGTLYNFRFDADTGPETVNASIGLFRTSDPDAITVSISAPTAPLDIPTVSQWGLMALALTVLTAGSLVIRVRRSVPQPCSHST